MGDEGKAGALALPRFRKERDRGIRERTEMGKF